MTVSFKDTLLAICTRVEPLSSTATQDIFLLRDAKEAKIAYDILTAHGFEARLYPEGNSAKLYLTQPDPRMAEKNLASAAAYARALKPIKQGLEALRGDAAAGVSDFTFTLATAAGGKQIAIHLNSPVSHVAAQPFAPAPVLPSRITAAKKPVTAARKKPDDDPLSEGPQLTSAGEKGVYRYMGLKVARSGRELMSMIIIGLFIITLGVLSKGYLCPDLATSKSKAWYCNIERR